MKKGLLWVVVLALSLTCFGALAETVHFMENSSDFDIQMELPEGAEIGEKRINELLSYMEIKHEKYAPVYVTIAPSDLYEKRSMNDLSDEELEELKISAGIQHEDPILSIEITPSGNKYIHICSNTVFDVDEIFTLYKGYFVQLTQFDVEGDFRELTEEDHTFMMQLLYNIEFIPIT